MSKNAKRIELVYIDPQYDFVNPKGALYVKGAENGIIESVKLIEKFGKNFFDIHVTMDMHHRLHIANPLFWLDSKGNHPNPFTGITIEDVEKGVWRTSNPSLQSWGLHYVKKLKEKGRFNLTIWPPHCLIGTPGNNIDESLMKSLLEWEYKYRAVVDYQLKGSAIKTEHYSAIRAEVEDPQDSTTMLNVNFVNPLKDADEIVLAGYASSHCLKFTAEDICQEFGDDNVKKIIVLKDCTAPVGGFEEVEIEFFDSMIKRGARVMKVDDYLQL